MHWYMKTCLTLISGALLGGCVRGESIARPHPVPGTPRDAHAMEPHDTDALRAWEAASRAAIRSGLTISPSFRERLRFPASAPHAVAYRFPLRAGQQLSIRVDQLEPGAALFADVFHDVGGDMFRHVHAAERGTAAFDFQARADGEYVLRLQPAVGGGGLYEISVAGGTSLRFPVADGTLRSVGSWFGDARDGGARSHEGVDIFAPRGAPVVAVTAGTVTAARHTPTGGNVVWLADDGSDLSYYYAHLDQYFVRQGARVLPGDTLGTVGTTGNAQGTSPHLHFGVYRPGTIALDPAPMLSAPAVTLMVDVDLDAGLLGRWAHVTGDRVRLRSAPSLAGPILAELSAATPVFVLGAVADWHRVVLPDGTTGFVSARFAAPAQQR